MESQETNIVRLAGFMTEHFVHQKNKKLALVVLWGAMQHLRKGVCASQGVFYEK
jgi:hypothetical protein